MSRNKSVAIIGGGPAGSTLAILLCRKGYKVVIFHSDKRPELIVGESLVPAVISMLKTLGLEEEIKTFSVFKPGATIWLGMNEEVSFDFDLARGKIPPYAYNTPRKLFDETLLKAAGRAGAKVIHKSAEVRVEKYTERVSLMEDSLKSIEGFFDGQPDLIVDATGRTRLLPRLLNLPAKEGDRKDLALFAHLKNVKLADPGNIHVDRHSKGWGWRIPLPGRVSVGIVVNPEHLMKYGKSKEEWYDHFIKDEPGLKDFTELAERISPVVQYTNYQKITQKMFGSNWALVGDSAGFLDPIFSTGLFLSMRSAFELAKAIEADSPKAMRRYEANKIWEFKVWQEIISSWYNGRLFTLFRVGRDMRDSFFGKFIDPHMTRHVTRIFTGEAGDGSYSRRLLKFMLQYGLKDKDPNELRIN